MIDLKLLVERLMDEASLTPGADINEIMMGFYLAGSWSKFKNGKDAQETVVSRKKMVGPDVYDDQVGRAKAMSQEVLNWCKANGYDDQIQSVWWTARPGILSKAMGRQINSKVNPTDILLDFGNGKFLGLSAKSTSKGSGDIGFKNPGMGTLGTALGIDFGSLIKHIEQEMIEKYKLPAGVKVRKAFIRQYPEIQQKTVEAGAKMLNILRDALLKQLNSMDQDAIRKHVISNWLNAEQADPYYVKVTGNGAKGKFSAHVDDPMNNDKFKAISSGKITAVPLGSDAVGITADNKRILKMRFKFESEKLASSIKLSGDPWSGESKEAPTPSEPQAPEKQSSGWFKQPDQNKPAYRKNMPFVQENRGIDDFEPGDSPPVLNFPIDYKKGGNRLVASYPMGRSDEPGENRITQEEVDNYKEGDLPPVTHSTKDKRLDPAMRRVVSF